MTVKEFKIQLALGSLDIGDIVTLASNIYTPKKILNILARTDNNSVKCFVAGNKNTPPKTLESLSMDSYNGIGFYLADNPSTPPNVLNTLVKDLCTTPIRERVAANPNTSMETLSFLIKNSNRSIRQSLLKNPKITTIQRVEIYRMIAVFHDLE